MLYSFDSSGVYDETTQLFDLFDYRYAFNRFRMLAKRNMQFVKGVELVETFVKVILNDVQKV